jgi:hypothetical protein
MPSKCTDGCKSVFLGLMIVACEQHLLAPRLSVSSSERVTLWLAVPIESSHQQVVWAGFLLDQPTLM